MSIGRKILLGIVGAMLVFFLFSFAVDFGVVRILGSPSPPKRILRDSGIYNTAVSSTLEQAKTQTGSTAEIPLNQAAIISAAQSSFTPQLIQTNTEKFIDGTYHWLDGKVPEPDFKIDLSTAKATFADKLAQIAMNQAASLPKCTTVAVPGNNFDVFSATCLPAGLTSAQVAATTRDTVLNGQGFLDKPVITADTLKSGDSNKSIFADQLKQAPDAFRFFKSSPLIIGIVTVLAMLGIIFLSSSRMKGLKHAGFILAGVGIWLILLALAVNSALDNKVLPKINSDNKVLQADIRRLVHDAVHQLDNTYLAVGAIYMGLGALAIGGYYLAGRKRPKQVNEDKTDEPQKQKEAVETSTEPIKPITKPETAKPKPKTRKKIEVR